MTTNMDFISLHPYTTTSFISTDKLLDSVNDILDNSVKPETQEKAPEEQLIKTIENQIMDCCQSYVEK